MKTGRFTVLLQLVLALTMILSLAVPGAAMSELESLFYEQLHPDEHMYREIYDDNVSRIQRRYREDTDYVYVVDTTHATRKMFHSVWVDRDVTIIDIVAVEVPEGKTLTVDKDATLVIHGHLVVHGKLDNRGTIVVGDKFAYKGDNRLGEKSLIENFGEVKNSGTIEIARGEIHNESTGQLENNGTIKITNKHNDLSGLMNRTLTNRSRTVGGTIVNNGTVIVDNDGGHGIRIPTQSVFENNGTVQVTETGTVNGTMTGNRPVRLQDSE